jgi:hypothetical protein
MAALATKAVCKSYESNHTFFDRNDNPRHHHIFAVLNSDNMLVPFALAVPTIIGAVLCGLVWGYLIADLLRHQNRTPDEESIEVSDIPFDHSDYVLPRSAHLNTRVDIDTINPNSFADAVAFVEAELDYLRPEPDLNSPLTVIRRPTVIQEPRSRPSSIVTSANPSSTIPGIGTSTTPTSVMSAQAKEST